MAPSEVSARRPQAASRPAGLGELAGRYDVLLCDLWGVMHDGRRALPDAVDATQRFRQAGGTVVFVTNSPRPRESVLKQIATLGVPDGTFDAVVTSGDVTVAAIAAEAGRLLYHIGPPRDLELFAAVHRRSGIAPRLSAFSEAAFVVVTGLFDDRAETPRHYADTLAAMRARDLVMICANPDIVVHIGETLIHCAGGLAEAYAALGGRTLLAGKPHAPIYAEALALAEAARGRTVARARVLAVGDGLVTDGAGAARETIDFLLVTSGIHRDEFHPDPDVSREGARYADRLAALASPPLYAMPSLCW